MEHAAAIATQKTTLSQSTVTRLRSTMPLALPLRCASPRRQRARHPALRSGASSLSVVQETVRTVLQGLAAPCAPVDELLGISSGANLCALVG
mmetsp:Transcript_73885/g.138060  ORF Transcript_73885/g.138060 Transcript_73885/m.138060 type:complete len:93 (+) Transcript_73885:307-585(+)